MTNVAFQQVPVRHCANGCGYQDLAAQHTHRMHGWAGKEGAKSSRSQSTAGSKTSAMFTSLTGNVLPR
eukprot:4073615-Amphidinium_carterae.1